MTLDSITPDLLAKLRQLYEKYAATGQDLVTYLDGLLQTEYLPYWDYVQLDTLLTLQKPRTAHPDELIFITYHQLTELQFKLVLHELEQIGRHPHLTASFLVERLRRINRYFDTLERSFAIMADGMERDQFLRFRTALMASSGFQSAQFRQIEIWSTDLTNLLNPAHALPPEASVEEQYRWLYWKQGATDLATQQKTLTLRQFEDRYGADLLRLAESVLQTNLWRRYTSLPAAEQAQAELIGQLREYDNRVNVRWKLAHLRTAVTYLHKSGLPDSTDRATGGTNWPTYLPPAQQQRLFFPALWSDAETQQWGRFRLGE